MNLLPRNIKLDVSYQMTWFILKINWTDTNEKDLSSLAKDIVECHVPNCTTAIT
jgi:hypothetical protein